MFDMKIASWDTASTDGETSDYSVGMVWGLKDATFYLLDVVREKLEVPELRRRIIDIHQRGNVDATLIEESDIGRAIAQDLRRSDSDSVAPLGTALRQSGAAAGAIRAVRGRGRAPPA